MSLKEHLKKRGKDVLKTGERIIEPGKTIKFKKARANTSPRAFADAWGV